jgi:2-succinyl-5-enolpyruvyl-6-hydroxy-3-cyclohexene-1-carboxylate synthase
MSNLAAARAVLERVRGAGVVDFCVCGGSRNAPLIAVLTGNVYTFVDERSAAFFALGRIKRDERPVAVITTSGTAVAELFPATVEAYYSGAPLVLITADRPARFRGTGAPQSIEQIGVFGPYAASEVDRWNLRTPLHVNLEFDEPLIDE